MGEVRTSLEVGFAGGCLPAEFLPYRGKATRSIPLTNEFPFEDAQFEVVLMEGSAISPVTVREAHRVLKPEGRLLFTVPEKTSCQSGYRLADVYAIVRDGFHIITVTRPPLWFFRRRGRTLTITARKKTWRTVKCRSFRPSCWQP